MVFSSQVFLFFFLPITVIGYLICRKTKSKNVWLLFVSVVFYAYGAREVVLILLFSVFANWLMALAITRVESRTKKRIILITGILLNLSYLFYYKYFNFAYDNLNVFFDLPEDVKRIALPIGISFFTFQALSYFVDVYRNEQLVQKNIINVALYITFFPQLIAGPIVRYTTIAEEITSRKASLDDINYGVTRFVYGLGKKVLVANLLGIMVDNIYAMESSELTVGLVWMAAMGYTLQIFFDFSGYSDMAIGLGRMFGFHFLENFNYPYISKSITEFWRRWHISLSSWFRDYIYIPLGGNRRGSKRQIFNLCIVWLCTGIWHGANWTFICWGVIYGIFVIGEKIIRFDEKKIPAFFGHVYTLFVVNLLWVFFRSDNMSVAIDMIKIMFGIGNNPLWNGMTSFYLWENISVFILAIIVSIPIVKKLGEIESCKKIIEIGRPIFVIVVLVLSASFIIKGSYNPFIYFNF